MRTAAECRAKSAEALGQAGRQSDARFKAQYEEMARAWAELATMAQRHDILAGLAGRQGPPRRGELCPHSMIGKAKLGSPSPAALGPSVQALPARRPRLRLGPSPFATGAGAGDRSRSSSDPACPRGGWPRAWPPAHRRRQPGQFATGPLGRAGRRLPPSPPAPRQPHQRDFHRLTAARPTWPRSSRKACTVDAGRRTRSGAMMSATPASAASARLWAASRGRVKLAALDLHERTTQQWLKRR
jgi:hypothetical protein